MAVGSIGLYGLHELPPTLSKDSRAMLRMDQKEFTAPPQKSVYGIHVPGAYQKY